MGGHAHVMRTQVCASIWKQATFTDESEQRFAARQAQEARQAPGV